jgi:outer membrane lipoprotein-sorting protein
MLTILALLVTFVSGCAAAACYEEMRMRLFKVFCIVSGMSFVFYITGINS